jgi:hypothetical protein
MADIDNIERMSASADSYDCTSTLLLAAACACPFQPDPPLDVLGLV